MTTGVNQFVPFATGVGANVITPTALAALPATATGFQSGIAQSDQLNAVWRQSSFVSAALSQIIADAGFDANDDGVVATYKDNFLAALALEFPTPATLVGLGFGGSIWRNVTSSRFPVSTTWTNSRGYPIAVAVSVSIGAYGIGELRVAGAPIFETQSASSSAAYCVITGIVPPGSTYIVNISGSGAVLGGWYELY